jgi:glutaryl-CoA dehydrogenase
MRDFFKFDELLTEEERIFRDMTRKWVREKVYPRVQPIWTNGTYTEEEHLWLREQVAKMGLFGILEQGGSYVMYGLACQEMEYVDSGLRSFVSVQNSLVIGLLDKFGSDSQKYYMMRGLLNGQLTGCFALTEPDFGSNPAGMKTHATPLNTLTGTTEGPDHGEVAYQINGSKIFITNGVFADFLLIWAKNKATGEIQAFYVPADIGGVKRYEIPNKMSLRYSDTATIYLSDAIGSAVPGAIGLKSALACLTSARYGIAWGAIGAAQACYERVLKYTGERTQFNGKPIASHQLVQDTLVEMLSEIVKAQFMTLRLGRLMDEGRAHYSEVAVAKRNNVRMALKIARDARDLLGAYGICTEFDVIRHMLNLESVITYEGTHNIQTLIVGREITGIGAF